MEHGFEKNIPSLSEEELQKLMQSRQAQQLLALLRSDGGASMQLASEAAKRGDLDAVKRILSPMLQSEEAEKLLKNAGGQTNSE